MGVSPPYKRGGKKKCQNETKQVQEVAQEVQEMEEDRAEEELAEKELEKKQAEEKENAKRGEVLIPPSPKDEGILSTFL